MLTFENNDHNADSIFFKKGIIIQRPGNKSKVGYRVVKGLLRSYTIDNKGREHNFMFAPENWIISDLEATEFNQPSVLFIQCMEDSWVRKFSPEDLKELNSDSNDHSERAKLLARRVAVLQRRVLMLMSATARERYEHFIDTYPQLIHRISQKNIASYLGITPEALSKIRREIVKAE
jgi:CRP-like cAMP-binding protein